MIAIPTNPRFMDLTGKTFGRLVVVEYLGRGKTNALWRCRCTCGKVKDILAPRLRNGQTRSCGCFRSEVTSKRSKTHGLKESVEYKTWQGIKSRCYLKSCPSYSRYGGRGIRVCERWRESFEAFLEDMGKRPSNAHSIEREENNGHYSPDNCRWATKSEQARNRRTSRMVTAEGKTQCLAAWAEETGIPYGTIMSRLVSGWTEQKAITEPVRRW